MWIVSLLSQLFQTTTGAIFESDGSDNFGPSFLIDMGAFATIADCQVVNRISQGYGILIRGNGTRAMIAVERFKERDEKRGK